MKAIVKRLAQTGWAWLSVPSEKASGITGFGEAKFFVVLILYILSFLVFANDGFFQKHGGFSYQQGIVTLVLALVLVTSFNWELCLFGKPVGANLFLHVVQVLPISLFIARITGRETLVSEPLPKSLVGWIWKGGKWVLDKGIGDIMDKIPAWVADMFSNWKITLLLITVMFMLSFRHVPLKLGAVVCALGIPFLSTIVQGKIGHLVLGLVLLGAGMSLQFCRYDKILYFENVLKRLQKSTSLDESFARLVMRIMTELFENARLREDSVHGWVRQEYAPNGEYNALELKVISDEIVNRMMFEYDLLVLRADSEGKYLHANAMLRFHDSLLVSISVFPRALLAIVLALVWVALPIDLIPDTLPIVGILDDMTVTIFSGLVLRSSIDGYTRRR